MHAQPVGIPMVPQSNHSQSFRIEAASRPEPKRLERLAYTYQEAADLLSISLVTIKRMVHDGELKAISLRGAKRITAEALHQLLKSGQS